MAVAVLFCYTQIEAVKLDFFLLFFESLIYLLFTVVSAISDEVNLQR